MKRPKGVVKMTLTKTFDKSNVLKIMEKIALVGEEKTFYRLYEMSFDTLRRYAVLVGTSCEAEVCLVGNVRERADEFFELVSNNEVTPCSLLDVAEDFGKNYI